MDFAQYDYHTLAQEQFWYHLRQPVRVRKDVEQADGSTIETVVTEFGAPLYVQADQSIGTTQTERPCRVLVSGPTHPTIKALLGKLQRQEKLHKMELDETKASRREALMIRHEAEAEKVIAELAGALVNEWENIIYEGREIDADSETVQMMFGPGSPMMFQQLMEAVRERGDFLTGDAAGS